VAAGLHRLRAWLHSTEASVVARRAELASVTATSPDVVVERASVCAAIPAVHSALADGRVSAGHADAIARAVNPLDDAERIELAAMAPTLVAEAPAA
jgi:hypothetical protein